MSSQQPTTPQPQAAPAVLSLLDIATVASRTGLSAPTIYRRLRSGRDNFPKPIRFTSRCNLWRAQDVESWVASVAQKSRGATKVAA